MYCNLFIFPVCLRSYLKKESKTGLGPYRNFPDAIKIPSRRQIDFSHTYVVCYFAKGVISPVQIIFLGRIEGDASHRAF